jgi:hypothetical protein
MTPTGDRRLANEGFHGLSMIAASPDENYVILITAGFDQNLWETDNADQVDGGVTWGVDERAPGRRRQGRGMVVAIAA